MRPAMMRFAVAMCGAVLLAVPAVAQKASVQGPTREQVRLRVLDQCVLTQSGKLAEEGAGPKCGCYAARITKAMSDEEVAGYSKGVPKRLAEESAKLLTTCK